MLLTFPYGCVFLNRKQYNMRGSNFWYYFIMIVVILHFLLGFGYLIYKLSPRKSDKDKKELNKNDELREEKPDN